MSVTRERVKTFDRLRGLSIVYMLITHLFGWFRYEESWWYFAAFPLTDFIGGCTFAFVAGAGLCLSMRKNPQMPARTQHFRSLFILGIGLLQNLGWPGFPNMWGWTILVALGVFRIVGYYIIKLPMWSRIVIMLVAIIIARPLFLVLAGVNESTPALIITFNPPFTDVRSIFAYVLYNLANQNTFFPYFGFFLGGAIFIDLVILQPKEKQTLAQRVFALIGIGLVILGVIMGSFLKTSLDLGDYVQWFLSLSGRNVVSLPSIVSRNSLPWSLTALGMQFLLSLLFLAVEQRVYKNRFMSVYGEYSLTIYIFHGVLLFISDHTWSLWYGLPILILTIYLIEYLCWIWWSKYKGKYSIEYLINLAVKTYVKHLEKKTGLPSQNSPSSPKSQPESDHQSNLDTQLSKKE